VLGAFSVGLRSSPWTPCQRPRLPWVDQVAGAFPVGGHHRTIPDGSASAQRYHNPDLAASDFSPASFLTTVNTVARPGLTALVQGPLGATSRLLPTYGRSLVPAGVRGKPNSTNALASCPSGTAWPWTWRSCQRSRPFAPYRSKRTALAEPSTRTSTKLWKKGTGLKSNTEVSASGQTARRPAASPTTIEAISTEASGGPAWQESHRFLDRRLNPL
jgi:hypothetical protein